MKNKPPKPRNGGVKRSLDVLTEARNTKHGTRNTEHETQLTRQTAKKRPDSYRGVRCET